MLKKFNIHNQEFGNAAWLMSEKLMRMGIGFFVGVWMARYLGPEGYGLLNYATALVAVFGVVATLGLNGVVVRDLIQEVNAKLSTLGSSFTIQLVLGSISAALCIGTVALLRPNDYEALLVVAILSLPLPLKAAQTVKYWFESRVQSRYTVIAEGFSFLTSSGARVILLANSSSIEAFAWVAAAEMAVAAALLMIIYAKLEENPLRWRACASRMRTLVRESAPLALSAVAVILYMKIDKIMVGELIDISAVGQYAVGVRLVEIWYSIPLALIASAYPGIIKLRQSNPDAYARRLQELYDTIVGVSFVIAVINVAFSDLIVKLLFGAEYQASSSVVKIYSWVLIFASLSVASGRWMIDEGLGVLAFRRNALGLAGNVFANWLLIPMFGVTGAALGTLFSFFVASYLSDLLSKRTRPSFYRKSKSLLFAWIFLRMQAR